MKQKLLELLKTKFAGVQDSILDRVADKMAKTVTSEDQIETALSGVTFDTLLQSETDRRVTELSETAVKNYEKKHKLKDGKPIEKTKEDPPRKEETTEEMPAYMKVFMEEQKELKARLEKQEKDREISSKQSQARELLKASKIPDKLKDKWIKRVDLLDEETSLEDQIKGLEDEYLETKQELVNESVDRGLGEKGGQASDADMKEFLEQEFPQAAKD